MQFNVDLTKRGFALHVTGAYEIDTCEFRYPHEVWEAFPAKQALVAELAYVSTLTTAVLLRHDAVRYTTPRPRFLDTYHNCFERAVPNVAEYTEDDPDLILDLFQALKREFGKQPPPPLIPQLPGWNSKRVVLPLSFGKDSLLSLATLLKLGYEVFPVSIDERVQPAFHKLRVEREGWLLEEFGLPCARVENEIQLLSDYEILGGSCSFMYQVQLYFIHLFAMLPFCVYHRAPTYIISSEFPNTLLQQHKNGHFRFHRVMQSIRGIAALSGLAGALSRGQINARNLIGGLGDLSIHYLLHRHFPALARYRVSCNYELTDHRPWCHGCPRCAHAYLFFLALGADPFENGFKNPMLGTGSRHWFATFKTDLHAKDRYRQFYKDEEHWAFLKAYANGNREPLTRQAVKMLDDRGTRYAGSLEKKIFRNQIRPGGSIENEAFTMYRQLLQGQKQLNGNVFTPESRPLIN
ncbi:MAG: hypothetical protein GY697_22525 [Desulfobacterales bacterium]|nr:hypothetical protein [Desulfobacterales bacterium]